LPLLLLCAAALCACAPHYTIPDRKPKAQVVFDLATESTHATGRNFVVSAFADFASCKASPYGRNLALKVFAADQELFGPLDVVAGEPLAFGVQYAESVFGGNRDCSYVAAFVPEPGALYVVSFRSRGEVASCDVTVQQQNPAPARRVQISAPERSCFGSVARPFGDPLGNGQAGARDMNITFTTTPPAK
jgi:hypothetical protein